jgi:hypothetical protein
MFCTRVYVYSNFFDCFLYYMAYKILENFRMSIFYYILFIFLEFYREL